MMGEWLISNDRVIAFSHLVITIHSIWLGILSVSDRPRCWTFVHFLWNCKSEITHTLELERRTRKQKKIQRQAFPSLSCRWNWATFRNIIPNKCFAAATWAIEREKKTAEYRQENRNKTKRPVQLPSTNEPKRNGQLFLLLCDFSPSLSLNNKRHIHTHTQIHNWQENYQQSEIISTCMQNDNCTRHIRSEPVFLRCCCRFFFVCVKSGKNPFSRLHDSPIFIHSDGEANKTLIWECYNYMFE